MFKIIFAFVYLTSFMFLQRNYAQNTDEQVAEDEGNFEAEDNVDEFGNPVNEFEDFNNDTEMGMGADEPVEGAEAESMSEESGDAE